MRRVVREWPANEAGRRAAELAHARGQLVHAERVGEVVRVVLRVPGRLTTTAPRQDHDRVGTAPRQGWQVPAAVFGGVVAAAVALVALLWWAVAWAVDHVALVLGVAAVLLIGAALLARLARGWGGDEHPCNR